MDKKVKKVKQISTHDLCYLFEQLSIFSKSGIPTWESLYIISLNEKNSGKTNVFYRLYELVADGMFFSLAMKELGCFPSYAVSMVEMAEQTGKTEDVFMTLHTYYSNRDILSKNIRSSVVYPLCMAGMVFAVVFILLVQVMPVFEQVFEGLGLALNPVSVVLLGIGQTLNTYAVAILAVVAAIILFFVVLKFTSGGKKLLLSFYEKFPLTRRLSESENISKFAFSMSLMIGSGLDAISSLEFASMITQSKSLKKKIALIKADIESGTNLSEAIISRKVFSPFYNGIVIGGVRSGAISETLMTIADRYSNDTQKQIQKILSIIEPLMLAVLCLTVGLVMLSVMLPLTGILSGM